MRSGISRWDAYVSRHARRDQAVGVLHRGAVDTKDGDVRVSVRLTWRPRDEVHSCSTNDRDDDCQDEQQAADDELPSVSAEAQSDIRAERV
jgi:hypothetical protein